MSKKQHLGQKARREVSLMKSFARVMPRDDLAPILDAASSDKRVEAMYNMLYDPQFSDMSLATMARTCGLTFVELCDILKKHRVAEAHVQTANHLPEVMEGIAEDAKNTKEFCPKCQGTGTIVDATKPPTAADPDDPRSEPQPMPITCPQCKGRGEIKKSGDLGARKLVLESMGMIGGRGPLLNINNNTLNVGEGDDLESVLALGKKKSLPAAPTQTIEAEVVKDGE